MRTQPCSLLLMSLDYAFQVQDKLSHHRCAEERTGGYTQCHGDDTPRQRLESFQDFTDAQSGLSQNRGRRCHQIDVVALSNDPITTRETRNRNGHTNGRDPENER